jgi:SAM-dependent methyltransferase
MSEQPVCSQARTTTLPRDFPGELRTLAEYVCKDPSDAARIERLSRVAEEWIESEGLPPAQNSERTIRVALAEWVSSLAGNGRIVHFGAREGTVAAALASGGAFVVSHLDHLARAVSAAARFGGPAIEFATRDQAVLGASRLADLVVVETDGGVPVLPLEQALGSLRAGGWLAVLGAPVLVTTNGLIECGMFGVDKEGRVRPLDHSEGAEQLTLLRFSARQGAAARPDCAPPSLPEGQANGDSPLAKLIASRRDRSEAEVALERRASSFSTLPIPDQELIDWVGGGTPATYNQIGLVNAVHLMTYCGLLPHHRILEPGCGCGRNARWVVPYLDPEKGCFYGFDILEKAVAYATREITSLYPNAKFVFADIRNTAYNLGGSTSDSDYEFPYESDGFDIVFLPSVFTHMTRAGFEHYAREIHRVLKPGGLLLAWHFLLNPVARRQIVDGKSSLAMVEYDEVSWARWRDNPCAAIAFDEEYVLRFYESLGLRAQTVVYGDWSRREPTGFKDYQDRVLAMKHPQHAK